MKKQLGGMNRADDAIALSNATVDLLSGKATNLDAINLAIKAFAVKCVQQRGHQVECKLNGKTSAQQNPYFARIAKEAPTHELEAKAKAKAEQQAKAKEDNFEELADFSQQLKVIAEKREALSQYDGREKATRDEKAKLNAEEQAIKARIKELS
jgi:hypothetical protein